MPLIKTKPRKLNQREQRFYKLFFMEKYSQVECARRAGYSPAIARASAYVLVKGLRELVSRLGYNPIRVVGPFFAELIYVKDRRLELKLGELNDYIGP
jgi:hypothetical protein